MIRHRGRKLDVRTCVSARVMSYLSRRDFPSAFTDGRSFFLIGKSHSPVCTVAYVLLDEVNGLQSHIISLYCPTHIFVLPASLSGANITSAVVESWPSHQTALTRPLTTFWRSTSPASDSSSEANSDKPSSRDTPSDFSYTLHYMWWMWARWSSVGH